MKLKTITACFWSYTSDTVRKCDIFGEDIRLNYKGKETFKTLFGGWASLMIFVVMVVYTVFLTNQVINKRGSNTTLSTKIKDLQHNPEKHQPGLGTFQFAIGAADNNRTVFYNESYFKIDVYQGKNVRDGLSTSYLTYPLNLTQWSDEVIDTITIASYNEGDRDSAKWLQNNNFTLSGTYVSNEMEYLYIIVRKWYSGYPYFDANCVSDTEIDSKLDGGMLSLILINSYVDFDDYENVIKNYVDERFYYKMRKGITKEPEILIRKNFVTLNDEFFQMGQTENKDFYSAENTKTDFDLDPTNIVYARMSIRMEAREDTYERTVFSIFDYTGLIGGVFEIFEVFGTLVVGYFTKKWFMFWVLSSLYQVKRDSGDSMGTEKQDDHVNQSIQQQDVQEFKENDQVYQYNLKYDQDEEEDYSGGEEEKYEDEKSSGIQLNNINVVFSN